MKKFLATLLAAVMLLSLAACGGESASQPSGSGGNESGAGQQQGQADEPGDSQQPHEKGAGDNYAQAYSFYSELISELGNRVNGIVDANNARLEAENPDTALDDPSYMIIMYLPFLSVDMAFTSSVTEQIDPAAIEMAYGIMGIKDAKFERLGQGEYRITCSLSNREDETKTRASEELVRYADGSIRYEQRIDGANDEFYEFISLGNDRYALQSATDRAIVTYRDGEMTQLLHSVNIHEGGRAAGDSTDSSVLYDPEADSIWGKTALDESWVLELESQGALSRIYELKDGNLTITGQTSNYDWETGETTFSPMEPVILPAATRERT